MSTITEMHGYKIGDTVYVKPSDSGVLKGKVVGFQAVDENWPIVKGKHPYKKGEKFKNSFSLDRISKTTTVTTYEWKIVPVKHVFKK